MRGVIPVLRMYWVWRGGVFGISIDSPIRLVNIFPSGRNSISLAIDPSFVS
jgi:hypothetical protein